MGHPTGCQRRVRSRHGGRAGGYQRPHDPEFPLVCLDETSKQLIAETRMPIPTKPGPARLDYKYQRNGTANLFMMFAPLEGWRHVEVTDRHTAVATPTSSRIYLTRTFRRRRRSYSCRTISTPTSRPHSTKLFLPPRHVGSSRGSSGTTPPNTAVGWTWLKSELSVLSVQCLDRRIPNKLTLVEEVATWERSRNKKHVKADWHFTTADARVKLKRLYPAIETRVLASRSTWSYPP